MASGTALGHGLPAPGVGEEHLCSPLHTRPLSVLFGNDRPTAIRANPPLALHVKLRPATREGSGYPGNRVVRGLALPDGLDGLLAPFAVHAALDSHRPSVLLPSPQMLRRAPLQKTAPVTAVNGVTGGRTVQAEHLGVLGPSPRAKPQRHDRQARPASRNTTPVAAVGRAGSLTPRWARRTPHRQGRTAGRRIVEVPHSIDVHSLSARRWPLTWRSTPYVRRSL